MLVKLWLLLLAFAVRAAATTCGRDDIVSGFPVEVAVEDGRVENWPMEKLTVAYEIYNEGVRLHGSKQSCMALGCYMVAISHYGAFPEAFQNAGNLLSGGCRDYDGEELYFLDNHNDLAAHYTMQSIKHARSGAFKATGWGNYVGHKLKAGSFKDNEEIRHTATQMRLALESIHPVPTPETPWPNSAHFSLALLYNELGERQMFHDSLHEILRIEPNDALAMLNVGNYYFNSLDYAQAAVWYGKSLESPSTSNDSSLRVLVLNNQGQSFRELGDHESSRRALTEALLLAWVRPSQAVQIVAGRQAMKGEYMRSLCLDLSMAEGDKNHISCEKQLHTASNLLAVHTLSGYWKDLELLEVLMEKGINAIYANPLLIVDRTTTVVDPYTFSLSRYAAPRSGLATHSVACRYSDNFPEGSFGLDVGRKSADRALKVGYLSGDWRNHPMGRLTLDLVTTHNLSLVQSQSLSYGLDDKSTVRREVELLSPAFLDMYSTKNDEDAHQHVASLGLDIVVDLVGHTYKGRLSIANRRPAPIIVNYLGYPGTMGCDGYDYTMVNAKLVPPEVVDHHMGESVVYLPHNYQTNSLPLGVSPCLEPHPSLCRERLLDHWTSPKVRGSSISANDDKVESFSSFFSPKHSLLCSFNTHKKFEPLAWQAWMNIMVMHPHVVLLLLGLDSETKLRIEHLAAFHGVSRHRLAFTPHLKWEDHLHRLAACDAILDTFVYGAHTTSSDALWMWVPVLSLESWNAHSMPSRVAASVSNAVLEGNRGGVRTVVRSVREYEQLAHRMLASNSVATGIRRALAVETLNSTAFDQVVLEACIERAYQAMYEVTAQQKRRRLPSSAVSLEGSGRGGKSSHIAITRERRAPFHVVVGAGARFSSSLIEKARAMLAAVIARKDGKSPSDSDAALAGRLLAVSSMDSTSESPVFRATMMSVVARGSREQARANTLDESLSAAMRHLLTGNLTETTPVIRLAAGLAVHDSHYHTLLRAFAQALESTELCGRKLHIVNTLGPPVLRLVDGWTHVETGLHPKTIVRLKTAFPTLARSTLSLLIPRRPAEELTTELRQHLAVALNNHAVCLNSVLERPEEALRVMISSLGLYHTPERLLNVALISQGYDAAQGFFFASQIIAEQQRGRFDWWMNALQQQGVSYEHEQEDILAVSRLRSVSGGGGGSEGAPMTIAIYCYEYGRAYWGRWGPSSEGGMGGSEEAVLYLSQQLGLMGHRVVIYADPPDADYTQDTPEGVAWRHHSWYDQERSFDLFIAWRYGMSLHVGRKSRKVFLWLQDLVGKDSLPPPATVRVSHIMALGEFHQNVIEQHLRALSWPEADIQYLPKIVANAAVDDKMLEYMDGANHNDHFVYGSNPTRGLEDILLVWPRIREALANRGRSALLHVYYGFPDKVVTQLRSQMGNATFEAFYERVMALLQQEGVIYHGSVDHQTLLTAYANAGFLLYPTRFPETGCITVQKAMACGTIPLTSRYSTSVLPFLTAGFDLGPENALAPGMNYSQWMENEWVPATIAAAVTEREVLERHRQEMKGAIREEYTWTRSAKSLLGLIL